MAGSDPPSPPSKEPTPQSETPAPEREKKPEKKLETPIVVAIISAVATLITSILGSPFFSTLVNQAGAPTPTPAAEIALSQNSLLSANLPGGETPRATFTPAASGTGLREFTATPPEEDSASAPPMLEPTSIATLPPPKQADPTPTAAPPFFQCLAVDVWFPYPSTLNPGTSHGCWDLAEWGFSTDPGRLSLVHNPAKDQQRGIYTPISGDVDIRFSLRLDEFRTRTNKAGFLNLGVVQNDPFSIYKGGYLSYQQPSPGTASPVRVLISGSNQATQKISALDAGFQHEVLLSIQDDLMRVYLNGEQAGDPVSLPHAKRAFWIGYVLPSKGELEVSITNFTIQTR
jgi:hypothetical protein